MKKWLSLLVATVVSVQLAAHTWSSPPAVISSGTNNATDPHVGIDANGNAVAVWVENNIVYAATQPATMSWTSPTQISGGGTASSPRIVVDPNGNATAIWIESNAIKARGMLSGMSWDATTYTLTSVGATATTPAIAVDPNGDVVAIWNNGGNIEASIKTFSGSWPAIPTTLDSAGTSSTPSVAIGADNLTVVAVWHKVVASVDEIYTSNTLIGNVWSAVPASIGNGVNPQVAVDGSGNALAVWYQFSFANNAYSNVSLVSSYMPSSSVFGAIKTLDVAQYVGNEAQLGTGNPNNMTARVFFSSSGSAVALWTNSFDGSTYNVAISISPSQGTSWMAPQDIVSINQYAFGIDLALDSRGDAFPVFMFFDPNSSQIQIQAYEIDINAFQFVLNTPQTLSSGSNNNGYPSAASRINNSDVLSGVAVWMNFDGTRNNIQSSWVSGSITAPPTGLMVTQTSLPLGVFTDYYNTVTWTASSSPNVAQYLIFRNGQYINTVSATGPLQYIDYNRDPAVADTYGIAAVDVDNVQSSTATVTAP